MAYVYITLVKPFDVGGRMYHPSNFSSLNLVLYQALESPDNQWPASFLHYTTSDYLLKILATRSLLFSSSSVMNDRQELSGALDIIRQVLVETPSFRAWCNRVCGVWPEFLKAFGSYFDNSVWHDRENLYLFCWCAAVSGHPEGKLSMWRAYGADGKGIAISIKTNPFKEARMTATLPIQLHRTRYEDDAAFCDTLQRIADAFADNIEIARSLAAEDGLDAACWCLFQAWFVAAATRKHPGFSEEDEWRFIYIPRWDADGAFSDRLEVNAVRSQLRPCFRLPIRDYADYGMSGTDLPDIIDCIIIGPNTFDEIAACKAVEMELRRAGVADTRSKIKVCHTPYRSTQ